MKNKLKNRFLSLLTSAVMLFGLLPTTIANAVADVDIISETKVTIQAAQNWARSKNATEDFINLAQLYWDLSKEHGNINPAIAYAQAGIETGYGKYGGQVPASYHNVCGLKNNDSSGFAEFMTWEDGVKAHLDHLALYAGAEGYPRVNTLDTRHFGYLSGSASTVLEMSKSWTPSDSYGERILTLAQEMESTVQEDILNLTSDLSVEPGNIILEGYAFSQNKIDRIDITFNGQTQSVTQLNNSNELANTYTNYLNSATGKFKFSLNTNGLSGSQQVKITMYTNYGTGLTKTFNLNVKSNRPKLPSRICLDFPKAGAVQTDSATLLVSGWALSDAGVKEVNVYLDDKLVGTTPVNVSRPDVQRVYPDYNDGNSGYSTEIRLEGYKTTRQLRVVAVSYDGTQQSIATSIHYKSLAQRLTVDTPKANASFDSKKDTQIKIRGWALSDKEISSVDFLIGNVKIGSGEYGISRPDVQRVYSDYNNYNSGYEGYVNLDRVPRGNQPLKIRINHVDGSYFESIVKVNVTKRDNLTHIDNPTTTTHVIDNRLLVRGWALNDSGISKAEVFINGVNKGTLKTGVSRPDVNRVYPGYVTGDNAGYESTLDINYLAEGKHTVEVVVTGKDGSTSKASTTFFKGNTSSKNKTIMIDPGHGGSDSGAVATHNGKTYYEKNLNLEISNYLKSELEKKGYTVAMTRTSDIYVGLEERSNMANNRNVDYFISIHQDSFTNASANGTTVFYTTKIPDKGYWAKDKNYKFRKSMDIGTAIVNNISSGLGLYNRGLKDESLSVTRNTDMPSNLVECGFISNSMDITKTSLPANQLKIAQQIAKAIDANL